MRLKNTGLISASYIIPSGTIGSPEVLLAQNEGITLQFTSVPISGWRVTELRLAGRRTTGIMVAEVLDSMFLNGGLEFLQYVDLSNNQLVESCFPQQVANLRVQSLNTIKLNDNMLSAAFMVEAMQIAPNLEHLFLRHGFASGQNMPDPTVLAAIPMMNRLRTLDCSHNDFTVLHAQIFAQLLELEVFDFSHNRIQHIAVDPLYVATNRPRILASGVQASFSLDYHIASDSLREVRLNHNQLGGELPIHYFLGHQLAEMPLPMMRTLRVLDFRNNRFDGVSPALFDSTRQAGILFAQPYFSPLCSLRVDSNRLQFDDLFRLTVAFGVQLTNGASVDFPTFTYTGQDSVGIGGTRRRGAGQPLNFDLQARDGSFRVPAAAQTWLVQWGVKRNNYGWTWGTEADVAANNTSNFVLLATFNTVGSGFTGTTNITAPTNTLTTLGQNSFIVRDAAEMNRQRPGIGMTATAGVDRSYVFSWIANDKFPSETLHTRKKRIVVADCLDSLGQPIVCQEIIVQTDPNATEAQLDSARAEFGAEVVESCHCGDVQLWALSDTFQTADLEANGAGTRSAIPSTRNKPGLRSVDANYSMLPGTDTSHIDENPTVRAVQGNTDLSTTLVAIIDSGTDPDHRMLSAYIRKNQNEDWEDLVNPQYSDSDGNCENNDVLGYNYVDNTNVAYDDHGHGTAIGGIIAGFGSPMVEPTNQNSIALLPIKYTDRRARGTTFHTACAIFYAADYHRNRTNGTNTSSDSVRVINASWGYYGEESTILRGAIEYANNQCGLLFVTSAGNDGSDNDAAPHYPASFDLPNVISVAATDALGNNLAAYSNYGTESVHIAARGSFSSTLIPQTGTSPDTSTIVIEGTSFSTALVSRAAALLFHQFPTASPAAVKYALMQSASPLPVADAAKIASGGKLDYAAAAAYLANMLDITSCAEYTINVEQLQGSTSTQVFPNPTQGSLFVQFDKAGERQIELIDAQGKRLSSSTSQQANANVNLSQMPQGIYLLRIQSADGIEIHKVMKVN